LKKRDYIFERVKQILQTYGEIKDEDKKSNNLFFNLSYTNKEEGAQNIKVDISSRQFGSNMKSKIISAYQ